MKAYKVVSTAVTWSVITVALARPSLSQSESPSLYLVSGSPVSKTPGSISTMVYAVDGQGKIGSPTMLSATRADSILIDYDNKYIAVTSPEFAPANVKILHFGGSIEIESKTLDKNLADSVDDTRLLTSRIGDAPMIAFTLMDEALGFDALSTSRASQKFESPHNGNCNYLVSGAFGLGEIWSDIIEVSSKEDKLIPLSVSIVKIPCTLGLDAPKDFNNSDSVIHFLTANTAELSVVMSSDERTPLAEGLGNQFNDIMYKSSGTWQKILIPGYLSRPRAFGDWVAYVVLDRREDHMGNAVPSGQIASDEGNQAKEEIDDSGWYIPGMFYLYNARTGKHILVKTGQSDSEPLLISYSSLYFRVGFSVYEVELGSSDVLSLSDAKMLTSDKRLQQVHWAFSNR